MKSLFIREYGSQLNGWITIDIMEHFPGLLDVSTL